MQTTLITDLTYVSAPPAPVSVPRLLPTMLTSRLQRGLMTGLRKLAEARLLFRFLRTPTRVKLAFEQIEELKRTYYGDLKVLKLARVAGRYYREYQTPGWPGAAYDAYVATTVNRLVPFRGDAETLNLVFLAITKKCPLTCDHCFEWDALNQKENLTREHIQDMVAAFQARHVSQIFFSGGETMLRVNDLVAVVAAARPGTDFWVITSGFNFTRENAGRLRQAGFTGVTISLDHHEADRHNAFRGSAQAYQNAVQAATYAHEVGLVVNLSLCATQEFHRRQPAGLRPIGPADGCHVHSDSGAARRGPLRRPHRRPQSRPDYAARRLLREAEFRPRLSRLAHGALLRLPPAPHGLQRGRRPVPVRRYRRRYARLPFLPEKGR